MLCRNDKIKERVRLTQEEFINRCIACHGNKFDYSKTVFNGTDKYIIIICKKHGEFEQIAESHYNGAQCFKCYIEENKDAISARVASRTYTTDDFIKLSQEKHGDRYDYSESKYINRGTKIKIICKLHGPFWQTAIVHYSYGCGCQKCAKAGISIKETQWLDELNILQENRQKTLKIDGKRYVVDGFDPQTNTVYEFNGDYWHGNPKTCRRDDINPNCKKTFGELYDLTIARENKLKEAGYIVISKWESDI